MGFVISLFAQTLVNPLWLEPFSQHSMVCAAKFPALGDDMKYGTVSPFYHCYLSYIISGGVTYQNNFPEIIINFMQGPCTSGIGQTMQK